MTDYGRYEPNTRERHGRFGDRDRDRTSDRTRGRDSIFGFVGRRDEHRDRDREHSRRGERDRERGGSRSSAWDRESRYGRDWDKDERYYGYDDYHEGLPIDETGRLIGSNKVEGTPVYGRDHDRLGTIYNFMVDKRSGQVEYAVMSYGGFLGLGQRYFPIPWRILSYDTRDGGYKVDMTERDLKDAPSFDRDSEPRFSHDYGRRVHSWYGLDY